MVDLSELRNYLEAQAELAEDEVFFDEPWNMALLKKKPVQVQAPVSQTATTPVTRPVARPQVSVQAPRVQILSGASGGRSDALDLSALSSRSEESPAEFLSANSLDIFYSAIARHSVYQGVNVAKADGNLQAPEVLLVFDFPQPSDFAPGFMTSDVGQMLFRMFAALSIPAGKCAMTYVYKRNTPRAPSALLDVTLRQMLEKEVSLIRPKKIAVFGELALRQMFGRDKSIRNFAGIGTDFAGIPSVALHDARAMLTNVALKKETWNVHLPKCGLFQR